MMWVTNIHDYRLDGAQERYELETEGRGMSWDDYVAWCKRHAIGEPRSTGQPGCWSASQLRDAGFVGLYKTGLAEDKS